MLTVLPFPWLLNLDLGPKVRGEVRKHLRPAIALKMVSLQVTLKPQYCSELDCACRTK